MPLFLVEGSRGTSGCRLLEALWNMGSARVRGLMQISHPTTSVLLKVPKIHPTPHSLGCIDRDHRKVNTLSGTFKTQMTEKSKEKKK